MRILSPVLVLTLLLVLVILPSCTYVTVTTSNPAIGIEANYTAHRFLWGWVGGDANTGMAGVARIEVGQSFGNWLITVLSVGLYCPLSVDVWPSLPSTKESGS